MNPTKAERRFLLASAIVWDQVALAWDGSWSTMMQHGLCHTESVVGGYRSRGVERVPSRCRQIFDSKPPQVAGYEMWWWPHGVERKKRATHARKLALRCRTLARRA